MYPAQQEKERKTERNLEHQPSPVFIYSGYDRAFLIPMQRALILNGNAQIYLRLIKQDTRKCDLL